MQQLPLLNIDTRMFFFFPLSNCLSMVESPIVKGESQLSLPDENSHSLRSEARMEIYVEHPVISCSYLWSAVLRHWLPYQTKEPIEHRTLPPGKMLDPVLSKFFSFHKTTHMKLRTPTQVHVWCRDWYMPSLDRSWEWFKYSHYDFIKSDWN